MRTFAVPIVSALSSLSLLAAEPPEPKFRAVEIDAKIEIGYGLAIADVNGDGKPDILLADKKQFVWYKNPNWEKFVLAENLTKEDFGPVVSAYKALLGHFECSDCGGMLYVLPERGSREALRCSCATVQVSLVEP